MLSPSAFLGRPLRRALLVLLLLSLIPALLLAYSRIRYEQASRTLAVVMDYAALSSQARTLGQEPGELLAQYRKLGVNGMAVGEEVVQSRIGRGEIVRRDGAELFAQYPGAGFNPSWTYLRSIKPGAAEDVRGRYTFRTQTVKQGGQTWIGWPIDVTSLSVGPNTALIDELKAQGLVVVYRPNQDIAASRDVAGDWPQVPFIAFNGLSVVGASQPARLEQVSARLGERAVAIIEDNPQKGLSDLVARHPAVRLFSIRSAWQKQLMPDEVASKFVLAARERSHRLLYVRPFESEEDTRDFLSRVQAGLNKAQIKVGLPSTGSYQPSGVLRALSLLGPLIALALLALSYPLRRLGLLVGLGTLALVVAVNLHSLLGAGALLAAVVFPALGFVLRRNRPSDWLIATALSLMGVMFVAGLGADRLSMLGLDPFHGVGLTLVVPLLLFALSLLPRQDLRKTFTDLYHYPLKLGDVAIIVLALAAVALIVLRRGNAPAVGVSDTEAKVRSLLQDSIIRPRFKEIAGHPAALLGLSGQFPPYLSALLLLGGVVAQSSILNTFSHFHTPLLISLQRAVNGVAFGGVIGFVALPLLAWLIRYLRTQPMSAPATEVLPERAPQEVTRQRV